MNAVSFDTLAVVRKLKAAGFSEDQAEAVTGVLQETNRVDLTGLATKADLTGLATKADLAGFATKTDIADIRVELSNLVTKSELKAELSNVVTKLEFKAELSDAKHDILKWVLLSAIGFQAIVIVGAIVALSRNVH